MTRKAWSGGRDGQGQPRGHQGALASLFRTITRRTEAESVHGDSIAISGTGVRKRQAGHTGHTLVTLRYPLTRMKSWEAESSDLGPPTSGSDSPGDVKEALSTYERKVHHTWSQMWPTRKTQSLHLGPAFKIISDTTYPGG